MSTVSNSDVQRFRGAIAHSLGLCIDESKLGQLAEVLRERLERTGLACQAYLARMADPAAWPHEAGALAAGLTVTETYFFRHMEQFEAFRAVVLDSRPWDSATPLRVLSAGCASGEEIYSLAILVREYVESGRACAYLLQAVDVNPVMLERARSGRFSIWSMREVPAEQQNRWFRRHGREFELDQSIRAMVTLEQRNLVEENASLWQPGTFHAVFCRNVLMYLTPGHARALVARIARSLVPGGMLFLGHAETLRGLSQDFELRHTHGTFYYEVGTRNSELGTETTRARVGVRSEVVGIAEADPPASTLASLMDGTASWAEAICSAAQRIRNLVPSSRDHLSPRSAVATSAGPAAAICDVGSALELLARERYVEALALVGGLAPESTQDVEVLLLRAVLLVHSGRLEEAAQACGDLLAVDGMNPGAHYLLALCHEDSGDARRAAEHDQIAVYLDPGFAMARLHLGLLSLRHSDRRTAAAAFREAASLLEREDASRLLLFGGGFGRDALVSLCRAELAACGEER